MTNKITKVYKNGVAYDIYASGGAAGTGDVTGPSSSTDADIALFNGATGKIIKDSGKKLSDYQTALSTQTAYSAKGTTTKVPQITTNTLGQVTTITEKSIAFPVTSVNGSTGAVTGLQTELVSGTNIKTVNGNSLLGSGDITVNPGIAKTFTLSGLGSTSTVLAEAQAIYDWYSNGGVPVVTYNTRIYYPSRPSSTYFYLSNTYVWSSNYNYNYSLKFDLSSGTVTDVTLSSMHTEITTSLPSSPNANTIYFIK